MAKSPPPANPLYSPVSLPDTPSSVSSLELLSISTPGSAEQRMSERLASALFAATDPQAAPAPPPSTANRSSRPSRYYLVSPGAISGGVFSPRGGIQPGTPSPASRRAPAAPRVALDTKTLPEQTRTRTAHVQAEGHTVVYETTKTVTRSVVKTKRIEYPAGTTAAGQVPVRTAPDRHASAVRDEEQDTSLRHATAARDEAQDASVGPAARLGTPARRTSVAHSGLTQGEPRTPIRRTASVARNTFAQTSPASTAVSSPLLFRHPSPLLTTRRPHRSSQAATPLPRGFSPAVSPATARVPPLASLLQPTHSPAVLKAPRPSQASHADSEGQWGEDWHMDRYYVKPSDGINPPKYYLIPHPSSVQRPTLEATGKRKYYIVIRGQEVGIFGSWTEAGIRVDGVSHQLHESCKDWDQALLRYTTAYFRDEIAILPFSGSDFDRPVQLIE